VSTLELVVAALLGGVFLAVVASLSFAAFLAWLDEREDAAIASRGPLPAPKRAPEETSHVRESMPSAGAAPWHKEAS
jgi:hypothetical protein